MDSLGCFNGDDVHELQTSQSTREKPRSDEAASASTACFDCNICLDLASEPVVTLCGHLYCWPCILKWINTVQSPQCPVCKASLSVGSLVPLYGAGQSRPCMGTVDTPKRPSTRHADRHRWNTASVPIPSRRIDYQSGCAIGGIAVLLLPWNLRNLSPYRMISGSHPRVRRHELQMERLLHQIWVFLLCCTLLCLLLF